MFTVHFVQHAVRAYSHCANESFGEGREIHSFPLVNTHPVRELFLTLSKDYERRYSACHTSVQTHETLVVTHTKDTLCPYLFWIWYNFRDTCNNRGRTNSCLLSIQNEPIQSCMKWRSRHYTGTHYRYWLVHTVQPSITILSSCCVSIKSKWQYSCVDVVIFLIGIRKFFFSRVHVRRNVYTCFNSASFLYTRASQKLREGVSFSPIHCRTRAGQIGIDVRHFHLLSVKSLTLLWVNLPRMSVSFVTVVWVIFQCFVSQKMSEGCVKNHVCIASWACMEIPESKMTCI